MKQKVNNNKRYKTNQNSIKEKVGGDRLRVNNAKVNNKSDRINKSRKPEPYDLDYWDEEGYYPRKSKNHNNKEKAGKEIPVNFNKNNSTKKAKKRQPRKAQFASIKKQRAKGRKKPIFSFKGMIRPTDGGIDIPMFLVTLTLLCFGLIMLYSASYIKGIYTGFGEYRYFGKQAICAVIGVIAMIVVSRIDYNWIKQYSFYIWCFSIILLCMVFFFEPIYGCRRWISIPGLGTFQPSEIAKLAIIITFARYLEQKEGNFKKISDFIPLLAYIIPITILLLLEPHNSCTIIVWMLALLLMFVGEVPIKWFILMGFIFGGGVAAIVYIMWNVAPDSTLIVRIQSFLASRGAEEELAYQTYMSLLAIGSGKWLGLGLGNSRQKHLHLPERQNDFIYAIVVEELGFIGGLLLISLFAYLFYRGMQISSNAKDKFGSLLTFGIVSQIAIQSGLNIAVATNTIPNTGIALPFFSAGGTALILILCEIGMVLSVARSCEWEDDSGSNFRNFINDFVRIVKGE